MMVGRGGPAHGFGSSSGRTFYILGSFKKFMFTPLKGVFLVLDPRVGVVTHG
jgi:hypothetical protein